MGYIIRNRFLGIGITSSPEYFNPKKKKILVESSSLVPEECGRFLVWTSIIFQNFILTKKPFKLEIFDVFKEMFVGQ